MSDKKIPAIYKCENCETFYDHSDIPDGRCEDCLTDVVEIALTVVPEMEVSSRSSMSEKIRRSIIDKAGSIREISGLIDSANFLKDVVRAMLTGRGDEELSRLFDRGLMSLAGMKSRATGDFSKPNAFPDRLGISVEETSHAFYVYGFCPALTEKYGHQINFEVSARSWKRVVLVAEEAKENDLYSGNPQDEDKMRSLFCRYLHSVGETEADRLWVLVSGKTIGETNPELFDLDHNLVAQVVSNLKKYGYTVGEKFIKMVSSKPVCCPRCKNEEFRYVEGIETFKSVEAVSDDGNVVLESSSSTDEGYDDISLNPRWECRNCLHEFNISESKMENFNYSDV